MLTGANLSVLGDLIFAVVEDLSKAVEHSYQAVSLAPQNHPSLPAWLSVLGNTLYCRFGRLGELEDLEKSIQHHRHAFSLTPRDHPETPMRLHGLGLSLCSRFDRLGQPEDIENAIDYLSQAVSLTPPGDLEMPVSLEALSSSLRSRFRRLGNLADLNKAIEYIHQAVSFTPQDNSNISNRLESLGLSLYSRFMRLGELPDLEMAIEHQKRALSLTSQGYSELPARLGSLGASFHRRFERLGETPDLDKAIQHHQQAVSLTPHDHPSMPGRLSFLGASLCSRFNHVDKDTDLDEAIQYQQQAVCLTSQDHPDMPIWLNNLGVSLKDRFEQMGNLADLDKSIELYHQAVSLTPQGPDMPFWLSNLGLSLQSRVRYLGELEDLEKAIEYHHRAVSQTPQDHPDLPVRLNSLSLSYRIRFERLGEIPDINKVIDYQSQAITLVPQDHSGLPIWLSNCGLALRNRFECLGELTDLNKAIEHQLRSVSLTPQDHPRMFFWLNNLGLSLHSRFERAGELGDLEKAVEYHHQAVSLAPQDYPDMPAMLANLGYALHSRFKRLGIRSDIDQSIDCFQKAAQLSTGVPYNKLRAAVNWAELCIGHRTNSLLHAYRQAMELLPQVVWIGNTVGNRYKSIKDMGSLCTEAAAAAVVMEDNSAALEWLEEGHSIVWKQMLQLRTPIDDLMAVDPALGTELKSAARNLEYAGSRRLLDTIDSSTTPSREHAAQQHRRLAENWEKLVGKARCLQGFEAFLRPRKISELMRSAYSSDVVMINVQKDRCDGLVIRHRKNEILRVPLVNFSLKKAVDITAKWGHQFRIRGSNERAFIKPTPKPDDTLEKALAVLWEDVVFPVLLYLGYMENIPTGDLPHVTWCTTGPLSFLPIHAAGNYGTGSMIYNYVISSYTPNLSVLLPPTQPTPAFSGVLAVGQKSAPGLPALPGTEAELAQIQEKFQGHVFTQLDGDMATPDAVLAGMEEHSWVHLACHAIQNTKTPTESAFYLHSGTLKLAKITEKQLKHADLAFLSACETATGDEKLPEEAVHLAAGMLMAGYRTVIATMWSIRDADAPFIAEKVYDHLLEGGVPDSRKAAVAVHKATKCLRDKVGVKEFAKWAPYIHIGQ